MVSDRHSYVQQLCFRAVQLLDYPNYDFKIIEISEDERNFNFLKDKLKLDVVRGKWTSTSLERVANARNVARKLTLEGNYDYMMNIDADNILQSWVLKKLVMHDKDCVGFVTTIGTQRLSYPCVFKSGKMINDGCPIKLDLYDWPEIFQLRPSLIRVHGATYGLIHRKVLEVIPYRFTRDYPMGEDIIFYNEIEDKGFEFWCDTSVILSHYRQGWSEGIYKLSKLGERLQRGSFI